MLNTLGFETNVVSIMLPCAQQISLAWTDPRYRKCIAKFKYKLMDFRINFFKLKWFLCPLFCVCSFLTVGQSTVVRQQHVICTGITSVRCRRTILFNFDCRVHLFGQLSIFVSYKFSIVVIFYAVLNFNRNDNDDKGHAIRRKIESKRRRNNKYDVKIKYYTVYYENKRQKVQ